MSLLPWFWTWPYNLLWPSGLLEDKIRLKIKFLFLPAAEILWSVFQFYCGDRWLILASCWIQGSSWGFSKPIFLDSFFSILSFARLIVGHLQSFYPIDWCPCSTYCSLYFISSAYLYIMFLIFSMPKAVVSPGSLNLMTSQLLPLLLNALFFQYFVL